MDRIVTVPKHLDYPAYDVPYKEWYAGHYDCCFVCLHPFIGLPPDVAAFGRSFSSIVHKILGLRRYPRREVVRSMA
jgi:hypothetical protein